MQLVIELKVNSSGRKIRTFSWKNEKGRVSKFATIFPDGRIAFSTLEPGPLEINIVCAAMSN